MSRPVVMEDVPEPRYEHHIELFNVAVGLIFHYLQADFPIRQQVFPARLGEPFKTLCETHDTARQTAAGLSQEAGQTYMVGSNVPPDTYIQEVLAWLEAEGFIRSTPTGSYSRPSYQITTRTFAILGNAPKGISERLGTTLDHAVRSGGKEVGKRAISEVVGHIIGAAVRGMAQ